MIAEAPPKVDEIDAELDAIEAFLDGTETALRRGTPLELDDEGNPYGPPSITRVPNRAMRRDDMRLKGSRRPLRSRITRKKGNRGK